MDLDKAFEIVGNLFMLDTATLYIMTFKTSNHDRSEFKLGLQYLEMVHNCKYLRITIDSGLTFTRHMPGTKRKVDSRFSTINACRCS